MKNKARNYRISRNQMINEFIDRCRVAANITEHHIISKLIFIKISIPKFINDDTVIIACRK